jgi:aspartate/glutamate racemase
MPKYPWDDVNAIQLFSDFLKVIGIAHLGDEEFGEERFKGKRLGVLNGSAWIMMWASYFGRRFLPGVHLVNAGNEAMQLNFMQAHHEGKPTPPQSNIDTMARYAVDLVELADVDAVIVTCSTMNRSYPTVRKALEKYKVPLVQIDRPMMEKAIKRGGRVLVVATHGPSVKSTQLLLQETAEDLGKTIEFSGLHTEVPWEHLAKFDIEKHNQALAKAVSERIKKEKFDSVVFAQLSMTAFLLSYPEPEKEFGLPIYTSGQCGFEAVGNLLLNKA